MWKYEVHHSITKIKSSPKPSRLFDFNFVTSVEISKIITSLDPKKRTSDVICTKIVKLANKDIYKDLENCTNEYINQNDFRNKLKAADITSIFKKEDLLNKKNHRLVSVLPTIANILERVLFDELTKFANNYRFPLLCGFRKGYST